MKGKQLYRVYFLSSASRDRGQGPEIDGVIQLSRDQFCQLSVLGYMGNEDGDESQFILERARPLSFKSVWDTLPKPCCEHCDRETTSVSRICDRCEAKLKCDNCGKSLRNKSWTEIRPDVFYCDTCKRNTCTDAATKGCRRREAAR